MANYENHGDYVMVDYSDVPAVADASQAAMGATSTYIDQGAGWLLLLPEKMKHLIAVIKGMPRGDLALWVGAILALILLINFITNHKVVLARVRENILSPAGFIIGGVQYILWQGIGKAFW